MRRFILVTLVGYKRFVSPLLPSACRFHPTCSEYMRQAVELHGPAKGVWLGLKRLGRCQPFCKGGVDPVPRPQVDGLGGCCAEVRARGPHDDPRGGLGYTPDSHEYTHGSHG